MMIDPVYPLIVGNWKMHKTIAEAKVYLQRLIPLVFRSKVGVWLAVPFTAIGESVQMTKDTNIQIGAQNMGDLLFGALTGEVSAPMLNEVGASFVILGHSERRRLFNEDNHMINRKVKLALRSDLNIILCIGETLEERKEGKSEEVISVQLKDCLEDVTKEQMKHISLAYEPVWAIGKNNPATIEIVEEIHLLCKNYVSKLLGLPPNEIHVLYGGSVNTSNSKSFLSCAHVSGLLIGGASLDVQSFADIVHLA